MYRDSRSETRANETMKKTEILVYCEHHYRFTIATIKKRINKLGAILSGDCNCEFELLNKSGIKYKRLK